jgi:hypothetical protein
LLLLLLLLLAGLAGGRLLGRGLRALLRLAWRTRRGASPLSGT